MPNQVAKLVKSKLDIPAGSAQPETNPKQNIYSLALHRQEGAASPRSAHAYSMSILRNALLNKNPSMAASALVPQLAQDVIPSAQPVRLRTEGSIRSDRMHRLTDTRNKENGEAALSNSAFGASTKMKSVGKTTTAASFFGSGSGSPESAKQKSSISQKENKVNGAVKPKSTEKKSKIKSKARKKTRIESDNDDECEVEEEVEALEKREKRPKRNVSKRKSRSKISNTSKSVESKTSKDKGNADDFIGDVDEDDDFLKEEEERKERNAKVQAGDKKADEERKLAKSNAMQRKIPQGDDNMDIDGDEAEKVTGAMDAFASKKAKPKRDDQEQKGKKRRKQVLEEKTFVDDNGFFRTETVAVWKDVEEETSQATNSESIGKENGTMKSSKQTAFAVKKAKNTKNMKQPKLMGFFTKK